MTDEASGAPAPGSVRCAPVRLLDSPVRGQADCASRMLRELGASCPRLPWKGTGPRAALFHLRGGGDLEVEPAAGIETGHNILLGYIPVCYQTQCELFEPIPHPRVISSPRVSSSSLSFALPTDSTDPKFGSFWNALLYLKLGDGSGAWDMRKCNCPNGQWQNAVLTLTRAQIRDGNKNSIMCALGREAAHVSQDPEAQRLARCFAALVQALQDAVKCGLAPLGVALRYTPAHECAYPMSNNHDGC